jgi:hypothetical protein
MHACLWDDSLRAFAVRKMQPSLTLERQHDATLLTSYTDLLSLWIPLGVRHLQEEESRLPSANLRHNHSENAGFHPRCLACLIVYTSGFFLRSISRLVGSRCLVVHDLYEDLSLVKLDSRDQKIIAYPDLIPTRAL